MGEARFAQSFALNLHVVLQRVLHVISTTWDFGLGIDFLLNLGDLVAEDEIKLEVLVDFLDAMHDGGVIFNTDFGGDLGGA